MKIRFSKTTQWILTIGILVALLLSAGIIYATQQARQNELSRDLAQAREDFGRFIQEKENLEGRLKQAQAGLSEQKGQFCASGEALEIQRNLLAAADVGQVSIASLSLSTPTVGEMGGKTYRVYSVGLTAVGETEALLHFSQMLGCWFPSATIGEVTLTTSDGGEKASLILPIVIYTLEAE